MLRKKPHPHHGFPKYTSNFLELMNYFFNKIEKNYNKS